MLDLKRDIESPQAPRTMRAGLPIDDLETRASPPGNALHRDTSESSSLARLHPE